MPKAKVTVQSNVAMVKSELDSAKARALERIGMMGETFAKQICPVRTGRLRNSISHARDDDAAYIGTNVEYAPHVELGTRNQRAKPYLRPAAQNHTSEYKAAIEQEMKR